MKIWHVGAFPSPEIVNGLNNTVWLVAKEQALMGHEVALLVREINDCAINLSKQTGLKLIPISATKWSYERNVLSSILYSEKPEIVHMHGVFSPEQATLGFNLCKQRIPYISTPHSLTPQFLQRGWLKKAIYNFLLEKPKLRASSAITGVTPAETNTIKTFIADYRGIICSIPNPVEISKLDGYSWKQNIHSKQLVYMGRFDVIHKGIDILVEIMRFLPKAELHLYGSEDIKTKQILDNIKANAPSNIYFHKPVFGTEKIKVLTEASLYIQASRWEVFGISIAEAMYLGLPCAISDTHNLAQTFSEYNLGCIFPLNPKKAAYQLSKLLDEPEQLQCWSNNSRHFAVNNFQPQWVANEYLNLYQKILSQ
jgi:glycosyltransferase involved in cell wall biosynthesis